MTGTYEEPRWVSWAVAAVGLGAAVGAVWLVGLVVRPLSSLVVLWVTALVVMFWALAGLITAIGRR